MPYSPTEFINSDLFKVYDALTGGGGASSNVNIVGDTVGLAKEVTLQDIDSVLSNEISKEATQQNIVSNTSPINNTDTFSAAGDGANIQLTNQKYFSVQITANGTVTVFAVQVAVSNDGINYTALPNLSSLSTLNSFTYPTGNLPYPAKFVKCRLNSVTFGTATQIKVFLHGSV